jgi:uncharacterized protein
MRVVIDTNILISACLKPDGNEARVLALIADGFPQAAVCDAIAEEYREVIARKKFAAQREALSAAMHRTLSAAIPVEPVEPCDACSDPDDNILLACAHAAGAACVVTGNRKHFPGSWRGVDVVNARMLLDRLGQPLG